MTPEQMLNTCRIVIYDVDEYFLDDKMLEEMNNYLHQKNIKAYFDYPRIGGGAEVIFHQLIAIGVEVVNGIGINALYDILKYSLTVISNKTKHLKEKPALFIECNEQFLKVTYGFELTDEQKDKIVQESLEFIKTHRRSIDD